MYLRFVCGKRHPHADAELGIYFASMEVDWEEQPKWLKHEFDEAFTRFCYLKVPVVLKSATRHRYAKKSLCWLKPEAEWLINEMRYCAWLLTEAGMPIREIRSRHPGTILWQDEDQIVSLPDRVRVPRAFA